MAALHTAITCIAGTVTALSNGAVQAVRLQRDSGFPIYLQATVSPDAPASRLGALVFQGAILTADIDLSLEAHGLGEQIEQALSA